MKGLLLVEKSQKGGEVLRRLLEENKRAPISERIAYKLMYSQLVVSEVPLTVRIEHRKLELERVVPPSSIAVPIVFALERAGVVKDVDFSVVLDE